MLSGEDFTGYLVSGGDVPDSALTTDLPAGFKGWLKNNAQKIKEAEKRGKTPYFLNENRGWWDEKAIKSAKEIARKIKAANAPIERYTYAAIEPFSPIIIEAIRGVRKEKQRAKIFESIIKNPDFEIDTINQNVLIHPLHKKKDSWRQTLQMARDIANDKVKVAFLPEYEEKTSADAITKIDGKWRVVDFKHCTSTKWDTIQKELRKAFKQAQGAVIKLSNADVKQFSDAIEYIKRNGYEIKDIKVINEYKKTVDLTYLEIKKGQYINKIRGKI